MRLLHLSDLHLSRYGETSTWAPVESPPDDRWTLTHASRGWRIECLRDRKGRADALRLVDPAGLIHRLKKRGLGRESRAVAELLALAVERHRRSAEHLMESAPGPEELSTLLEADPGNANVRFIRIAGVVRRLNPDLIVVTGDLTDEGFGYRLVRHVLAPWAETGRLFTVPGNHDIYDMLPHRGRRQRSALKARQYRQFAASIGLPDSDFYLCRVGAVALVGLDSCAPPSTPLSAAGAVPPEGLARLRGLRDLAEFRGARVRIGLVHHHLLRMPLVVGKRSPLEVGMRLRNAGAVMRAAAEAGLDFILHGHRHHGYVVHLPGRPTVVSAPSSTLGCKSLGRAYAWLLDLDASWPCPRMLELP